MEQCQWASSVADGATRPTPIWTSSNVPIPGSNPHHGINSERPMLGNGGNFQTQRFVNRLAPPIPGHLQSSDQYLVRDNQNLQQGHNCNSNQPPNGNTNSFSQFRQSNANSCKQGFPPQSFGSPFRPIGSNVFTDSYPHQMHQTPRTKFTNWNNLPRKNWQQQGHHNKSSTYRPPVMNNSAPCHCEPCEKEFKCQEDFVAHQRTHVKCEFNGCSFIASKKMVKLHFSQKHEEGKCRIRLENDEDIAKWKEERKRKFPTASKVSQKIEEEKEKIRNGQVLRTKEFRYKGKGPYGRGNPRGRGNSRYNGRGRGHFTGEREDNSHIQFDNIKEKINEKIQNGHSLDETNSIQPLSETSKESESPSILKTEVDLCDTSKDNVKSEPKSPLETRTDQEKLLTSTSEVTHITVEQTGMQLDGAMSPRSDPETQSNALLSICAYISEEESDPIERIDNEHTKSDPKTLDTPDKQECQSKLQEEVAVPCKVNEKKNFQKRTRERNNNYKKSNSVSAPMTRRNRRPNLLEMLLANDIRHERNIILQCIRHIVGKNFFDD